MDAGADLEAKDLNSRTPLHMACWNDHIDFALTLLMLGADVQASDKYGNTALHFACMRDIGPTMAMELASAGANPNLKDNNVSDSGVHILLV